MGEFTREQLLEFEREQIERFFVNRYPFEEMMDTTFDRDDLEYGLHTISPPWKLLFKVLSYTELKEGTVAGLECAVRDYMEKSRPDFVIIHQIHRDDLRDFMILDISEHISTKLIYYSHDIDDEVRTNLIKFSQEVGGNGTHCGTYKGFLVHKGYHDAVKKGVILRSQHENV